MPPYGALAAQMPPYGALQRRRPPAELPCRNLPPCAPAGWRLRRGRGRPRYPSPQWGSGGVLASDAANGCASAARHDARASIKDQLPQPGAAVLHKLRRRLCPPVPAHGGGALRSAAFQAACRRHPASGPRTVVELREHPQPIRRLTPAPRPRTAALPLRTGSGGVPASGAANGRAWCAPDQGTDRARRGKPAMALRMGGDATGCRIAQGPVSPARLAPPNGPQRKWLGPVMLLTSTHL